MKWKNHFLEFKYKLYFQFAYGNKELIFNSKHINQQYPWPKLKLTRTDFLTLILWS